MNMSPVVILTTVAAIASAAASGMMYVFSTFVMRGLDRTGPANAITAMRGINVDANSNAPFLLAYFGAAFLAVAVGVDPAGISVADAAREWQAYFSTWTAWNHARTATAIIASALMLIGLRYR